MDKKRKTRGRDRECDDENAQAAIKEIAKGRRGSPRRQGPGASGSKVVHVAAMPHETTAPDIQLRMREVQDLLVSISPVASFPPPPLDPAAMGAWTLSPTTLEVLQKMWPAGADGSESKRKKRLGPRLAKISNIEGLDKKFLPSQATWDKLSAALELDACNKGVGATLGKASANPCLRYVRTGPSRYGTGAFALCFIPAGTIIGPKLSLI